MKYFNQKKEGEITPQEPVIDGVNPGSAASATQFEVSEFLGCRDNVPKSRLHTWQSFCEEFGRHIVLPTKDGPAWSPARFLAGATRKNENVQSVQMAVIDIDGGAEPEQVCQKLEGHAYLVHSSYSHTLAKPKFRIVMPLVEPVNAEDWHVAWAKINQLVGGINDASTKDLSRLYYKPAKPPEAIDHFVRVVEGRPLDANMLPDVDVPARSFPITSQKGDWRKASQQIEGIESDGPDLRFRQGLTEVVKRCAFMQFASAPENQSSLAEPLWMAMVTNACRFENSEPWIHAASEEHAGYSEAETDGRIKRYRNDAGPVTCQRIQELGFNGCPSGGCRRPNGEVTRAPAGLMGWMFRNQLTETEATAAELPEQYNVDAFEVSPEGVFQIKSDKEGEPEKVRLSSRIDVTALTRDHDSLNWGLELHFKDPDGILHRWAMPNELLASAGDSYRASLLKMGASLEPSKKARDGLAAYLVAAKPSGRALSVRQPGWFNGSFVLPDAAYGRSEERVVFQTNDPDEIKRFSRKGSLDSWQQEVALPSQGNSRAVISICIGLAPPLLALLSEDNGGFHMRGNSSIGKSICLQLGSSVWGGSGLTRTWNMTVNGLEGVATMHNDVLLPLDELGQADPAKAGEAAYMLGNGQGKARATKDGDARSAKRWRNLVLSSGEKGVSDLMAAAGQLVMAGQEVRMVEIPADAGRGYGVFEDIHGARSSQAFAESMKRAIAENHGHAGRALVECLADPELQPKLVDRIKSLMVTFVEAHLPSDATGQVGRVGNRFALVAAVGELCIELGIVPWPEGEAVTACGKCFQAWIELRGGVGNHEAEQATARVRRFIEMHGESRFSPMELVLADETQRKTINRAGFRKLTEDGGTEFFIFPEVYKAEVCAGLNPTYVTKILVEAGHLGTTSNGKAQIEKRLPGIGKHRIYHLKASFMADEAESVSPAENGVTEGRQERRSALASKYIV